MSKKPCLSLELMADSFEFAKKEDGGKRKFAITAYTGQVVTKWWEDIVIKLSGIQSKKKLPVFRQHDPLKIVGVANKKDIKAGKLIFNGEFSSVTQDSQDVQDLADDGFPWQASMGIKAVERKILEAGQKMKVNGVEMSGPLTVWTKSIVDEVSFVPLGADNDTEAIALAEQEKLNSQPLNPKGDTNMDLAKLKSDHPEIYAEVLELGVKSVDQIKIKSLALAEDVKVERERVAGILKIQNTTPEMKLQVIESGISVSEAKGSFWDLQQKAADKARLEFEDSTEDALKPDTGKTEKGDAELTVGDMAENYRKDHPGTTYVQAVKLMNSRHPELYEKELAKKGDK